MPPSSASNAGNQQPELDLDTSGLPTDVDVALRRTLEDMLHGGTYVAAVDSGRGASWERLHYTTGMSSPLARIGMNPARRLNLVGAIARFVWMVGASDRLEDIAYYEEQVRHYTDNEISVPGSSYGRRIFESSAGLNQLHGAVERLKKDRYSRQSAVVVWAPGDAVRESKDIPCTFGFFYHVRDGQLIASTIMRSNNACILLPYNFFEFSLLAEVVAASVGVPIGSYVHWAASMHVFEGQKALAEKVLASAVVASCVMPEIPRVGLDEPSEATPDANYALEQVRRLAALEPRLRNASTRQEFRDVLRAATDRDSEMWLNDYWRALFNVLTAWGAAKRAWWDLADAEIALLPEYLRGAAFTIEAKNPRPEAAAQSDTILENLGAGDDSILPLDLAQDLPVMGAGFREVHETVSKDFEVSSSQADLEAACTAWAAERGEAMTLAEMQHVRETARAAVALAARSQSAIEGGSAADRETLSNDAISAAIQAYRRGTP